MKFKSPTWIFHLDLFCDMIVECLVKYHDYPRAKAKRKVTHYRRAVLDDTEWAFHIDSFDIACQIADAKVEYDPLDYHELETTYLTNELLKAKRKLAKLT